MNNSKQLIALKEAETAFLKYFNKADYELVDFSVVEKLDWKQLNHEDLQQMGERNFWQHEHQIYALRNDFTDQLLRYYSMYPTAATKVAYTGLIIRNNEAAVQVGLENYAPSLANVQQSLKLFIQFIQQQLRDNVHFVVLGHYQLLDALLDKSLQTPDILSMIEERNLSGLVTYLSTEHPIVQILKENTQQQLNVLEHYIPNDHPALVELKIWERWLHTQGYKDIHLDITAQPPRSYYTGLFIQCHFAENESRVLTGGYYKGSIEGFGLGLTASLGFVDIVDYEYQKGEKRNIYEHDIIYTTNGRLGFDYLIDNLADSAEGKFLPQLNYGIIDEVDSIILDAAQTPLVISGAPRLQSNLFHIVKEFVDTLIEDVHFKMKKTKKEIWLLNQGIEAAQSYFNVEDLYSEQAMVLVRNINLALRAQYLFESNVDYFVYNGDIVLIDRITGRMLPGTKLQAGLHQAIEAKEGMEVSTDKSVMATITFQNLFKLFESFSGMTATGKLGESEFFDLYSKIVVQVPTDKAIQRIDELDKVFRSVDEKNIAMIHDIVELHETGRPVLLITRTAEAAEYFSKVFFQMDIPNNLLIAQNVAKEAQMIAEAGQIGSMTVATSMAGRGTDIKLGEGVEALGGLAVIIHEHMENSRVDRQLRGRSGRQGDPGSSCIYISLDDYLVKRWSDSNLAENNQLYSLDAQLLSQSSLFNRKVKQIVVKAQRISEEQGVKAREMANEFEKSISIQRDLVYEERNRVLEIDDAENRDFKALAKDVFEMFVNEEKVLTKSRVVEYIYQNLSFQFNKDVACVNFKDKQAVVTFLLEQFEKQVALNRKNMQSAYYYNIFVQKVFLKAIDSCWLEQVDYLQQLKASVNQRQNGQRNAIFEYHRVALDSFEVMTRNIKKRMVKNICQSMITFDKEGMPVIHFP
ncbi:TPA: accessory Sec system translocase SecA2 [Staphylococcus aureus]|nr:accessory Sec system translocase SecA2 [Staphylococcus aureus]HCU8141056.1 accessory Sec system translocase SecA2 [Staphylococcus aureus]